MRKYPIYLQDNEYSCGVYCIKMLLNYYKSDDEIRNIKQHCRLTQQGVTVYGMINALKDYHIDAKAYKIDRQHIDDITTPSIIHLKLENVYHYVVLYKKTDKYFLIGDPAKGLIKMNYETFYQYFDGVVIMILHVGHPIESRESYSLLSFVSDHIKHYYPHIIKIVTMTLFISLATLIFSYYYQLLIDRFYKYDYMTILLITLCFIVVYIIKLILDYYRNRTLIETRRQLNEDYVTKTMLNTIYLPPSSFQQDTGKLLTRANQLFDVCEYFIEFYDVVFVDGLFVIAILCGLAFIDIRLCLLSILFMMSVVVLSLYQQKHIHLKNKHILEYKEKLNQGIIEYQSNHFQSLQFRLRRTMKNKLAYLYDHYYDFELDKNHALNIYQIKVESLVQTGMMIVLLIALYMFKQGNMTIGTVIFIYMLYSYLVQPILHLASFMVLHDEMKLVFERYKEYQSTVIKSKRKIKHIYSIELKNVTFSYGYSQPILQRYNLCIDQSLILSGHTGCGKSTLLKLITGQLEPLKGQILINGKDLKTIDLNSVYSKMKYLEKTPVFYEESLEFNMILDNKRKKEDMINLLYYFQITELIDYLHQQLTVDGGWLSSGQRQLVMLIRALLLDLDVLILDEAFSQIDETRVKLLLDYLKRQKMIVIIVSHQINLMNKNYDCVIIDLENK